MKNKEKITSITFRKTSNVFVNTGIVAVNQFIERYKIAHKEKYPSLDFKLCEKELQIECDNLLAFLEDLYYFMGKEVYDTVTEKQKNENYNIYYIEEDDEFKRFPKMNTYGLTHLLTNNAQGVTRGKNNAPKIKQLEKDNPELAQKIKNEFERVGAKLLSKVYINEPYTKITRLDIGEKYLEEGKYVCPITGENFKALLEAKNTSPFVSGLTNFNSFLGSSEKKISWKALYLIRFSPALCFYSYQNNYETLMCSFFNSNNLKNIEALYDSTMFFQKEELEKINFRLNFKLKKFYYTPKGKEKVEIDTNQDIVWQSEMAFMLLYTFYKKKFEGEIADEKLEKENQEDDFPDFFNEHPLAKVPITMVTFRADKFASTLRPNYFEEFNHVKYIMRLIYTLEAEPGRIPFQSIWIGLKLNSPKAKSIKKQDFSKGKAVERLARGQVFSQVLKGKTILPIMESFFYDCYLFLAAKENIGYRRYSHLLDFLSIYEKSIHFSNNKFMNEKLQKKSIGLGRRIGQSIVNYDSPKNATEKQANAKNGRKYIIQLHKARTEEKFTEAIIAMMKRFLVGVDNEILENMKKDNFIMIRQYIVIGALNSLNATLSQFKKEE